MGERHEERALSVLQAFIGGDIDAILAHFSTDAVLHSHAWRDPAIGRQAIRDELDRQAALYTDLSIEIRHIASTDGAVLTERLDSFYVGNKAVTIHIMSTMEMDEELLITSFRNHFDSSEIQAQLD